MDAAAFVSQLLEQAIDGRASDIHIEPQAEELRIRQRVDGFLVLTNRMERDHMYPLISRIKVMAHLDIGEKRLPQDGAMTVTHKGERVDIRVSTMPTLHGEKVVLRLLRNRPELITLTELGIGETEQSRLDRLILRRNGLIIATGPTGAGKTTTLYAILKELNRIEQNIVTLEDPIEVQLPGLNQIQIHPKAGLTFAHGLRAVLRQDPNIIMLGEIRDLETAEIAVRAALTGHLVLSTLHTIDSCSAITRLIDMGIAPYLVASALKGIIAQRLIRLICKGCEGTGCQECNQIGYQGRTGVFEILVIDELLERLIVEKTPLNQLREITRETGMRTLAEAIKEKVEQKKTTQLEYFRVVNELV